MNASNENREKATIGYSGFNNFFFSCWFVNRKEGFNEKNVHMRGMFIHFGECDFYKNLENVLEYYSN